MKDNLFKLYEDMKKFVLGRRDDIKNDIEDFGMLKDVLESFENDS